MSQQINESIERNSHYSCKVPSCSEHRHLLSGYCNNHFKKMNLYGNPEGQSLRKSTYRQEYKEVSGLVNANLTHVSTVTALEFIQAWLDRASSGVASFLGIHMSRLALAGVTPIQILIEATSVYLYSHRNPRSLPDDDQLSYQIGIAILRLAPSPSYTNVQGKTARRRPAGTNRRALGRYLRDHIGVYFFNVTSTIVHKETEERERREKLYTPLDFGSVRTDF
jgi:hypothetical protein